MYKQIEVSLHRRIMEGQWPLGAMLPSRRDLARQYGVSPLTVERAVARLITAGLLRADDRRGTFVTADVTTRQALSAQENADLNGHGNVRGHSPRPVTIGIIAALYLFDQGHMELNNFWVRLLIGSLEQSFSGQGHVTRLFNRVQGPGQPVAPLGESIAYALAQGVDALAVIVFGLPPAEIDAGLAALDGQELPTVCVTSQALRRPIPHVFYDNHSAGYQGAQHLLRGGCRDLAFFSPYAASWAEERIAGALVAAEHAGLAPAALQIAPATPLPWMQEEDPEALGYGAASAILDQETVPSGVICVNDGTAFGFLRAASERGLVAGRDFSVLAFDDHPQARAIQLTSLRPPMAAMGQEAARLLRQALSGENSNLQSCLRWHLIPRASTSRQSSQSFTTSSIENDKKPMSF